MQLQVPNIVMSLDEEEQAAMENRSKLRLVAPHERVQSSCEVMPPLNMAHGEMEKTYKWLTSELKNRQHHYRSQRAIFGAITFEVPVSECKPEMVVAILSANNVSLLEWKNIYTFTGICGLNEKRKLVSVELTFDTPEIGVLNMPI